jgi:hypothetical protein
MNLDIMPGPNNNHGDYVPRRFNPESIRGWKADERDPPFRENIYRPQSRRPAQVLRDFSLLRRRSFLGHARHR